VKEGFRQSMAWLHTWSGLVVGWVLFFVFVTGSVGYIEHEISRWMQPEKPMVNAQQASAQQQLRLAYRWLAQQAQTKNASSWSIAFKTPYRGDDQLQVDWVDLPIKPDQPGTRHQQVLDLHSGAPIVEQRPARDTGGGFVLYRMHYALHYIPYDISILIVGACTMVMFVALISGVITHKKIFKDFFTFRPAKGQRSWLDAHNVISVIALPFYLMITYSGLVFFYASYMPLGLPLTYGAGKDNALRFYAQFYPEYYTQQPKLTEAQLTPIAARRPTEAQLWALYQQVEQRWGVAHIARLNLSVSTPSQPVKVNFYAVDAGQLLRHTPQLSFELHGAQSRLVPAAEQPNSRVFSEVLLGLHEGRFASAFLRWIYVLSGLLGAAMIATGLVLWTVKRRPKQIKQGRISLAHAAVERLNIGMIVGLPLGISIYFWANRLLPVGLAQRADWEVHCLFLSLLFALLYSCFRPIAKAWYELLALLALSLLSLPLLNALSSDRHLWASFHYGDWALFSMDVGFVLMGSLFAWMSYAVWRKRDAIFKPVAAKHPRKSAVSSTQPSTKEH
jgi:uncharacterized iron-regulated membrane protein